MNFIGCPSFIESHTHLKMPSLTCTVSSLVFLVKILTVPLLLGLFMFKILSNPIRITYILMIAIPWVFILISGIYLDLIP